MSLWVKHKYCHFTYQLILHDVQSKHIYLHMLITCIAKAFTMSHSIGKINMQKKICTQSIPGMSERGKWSNIYV